MNEELKVYENESIDEDYLNDPEHYESPEMLKKRYERNVAKNAEAVANGTETKLVVEFVRSNGTTMSQTYKYAKSNVSSANAKALMQAIIANGNIFQKVPSAMKAARIVTTDTTEIDLS